MLKQFEIHGGVVKNLNAFLAERGIDLKTAMDAEETNKLVAAIIHEGLPGMVRRIYSLQKMQTFFWEKKDLMVDYVAARLEPADKKAPAPNYACFEPGVVAELKPQIVFSDGLSPCRDRLPPCCLLLSRRL